jgi:crossover junction endodeoxyribonuclease RuvC
VRIFSADLSLTATGCAVAIDGKLTTWGLIPGKHDGVQRLIYVRNRVCDKIDEVKPDLVIFEDFSYASKDGKAFERAGLAFMIRSELFTDKIPFCVCSPQGLKKFVVGTAGSPKKPVTKELVIKEVFKRWGFDVDNNDEADAIGLAHVGMALVGDYALTMQAQHEVLETIRNNNPFLSRLDKREASEW